MVDKLDEAFSFYENSLGLRAKRQQVLSDNIANADTPGYKARDFDFTKALDDANRSRANGNDGLSLTRTNAAHIPAKGQPSAGAAGSLKYRVPSQPSLDGNTVDMDLERLEFMKNTSHYLADTKFTTNKVKELQQALQPPR